MVEELRASQGSKWPMLGIPYLHTYREKMGEIPPYLLDHVDS